jgi:hypothetical protein
MMMLMLILSLSYAVNWEQVSFDISIWDSSASTGFTVRSIAAARIVA